MDETPSLSQGTEDIVTRNSVSRSRRPSSAGDSYHLRIFLLSSYPWGYPILIGLSWWLKLDSLHFLVQRLIVLLRHAFFPWYSDSLWSGLSCFPASPHIPSPSHTSSYSPTDLLHIPEFVTFCCLHALVQYGSLPQTPFLPFSSHPIFQATFFSSSGLITHCLLWESLSDSQLGQLPLHVLLGSCLALLSRSCVRIFTALIRLLC